MDGVIDIIGYNNEFPYIGYERSITNHPDNEAMCSSKFRALAKKYVELNSKTAAPVYRTSILGKLPPK